MKVYITNYNAKKIISNLNHNVWFGTNTPFHKQFKWLNIREISELHAYYFLYTDPAKIATIYKENNLKTNDFVFESNPAYHKYQDCSLMKSAFENFKIPNIIKKQGVKKINEYINFFKTNRELAEKDFDFFKDRIRWKFGSESIPERVNYENSGALEINNYSLDETKEKINLIISETKRFVFLSRRNKSIINSLGDKAFLDKKEIQSNYNITIYSNEEVWEVLNEFNEKFKKPYKRYVVDFFRLFKNPELEFENNILDKLGFIPCKKCNNKRF